MGMLCHPYMSPISPYETIDVRADGSGSTSITVEGADSGKLNLRQPEARKIKDGGPHTQKTLCPAVQLPILHLDKDGLALGPERA